jgi:TDG/mug DNA glycosylase family protein
VNNETSDVSGDSVVTLKDLLKPGLRAIFVGINPSPVSVEAGHYYQGRLGQRFWSRLATVGIVRDLSAGVEDDIAFEQGLGFTDIVKRPTARSSDISDSELFIGAPTLASRIEVARGALVIFVFKRAFDASASDLVKRAWRVARMPGPYAAREQVEASMRDLAARLM